MTIHIHQTKGYGLFRAVAELANGLQVEAHGLTEREAERKVRTKATQEPCAGCQRPVSAAEADVCRAARIPVLCSSCREGRLPAGWYDASDPER